MTQKKIDRLLWFFVALLPVVVYFIMNINNTSVGTFISFMTAQGFTWTFVYQIFNSVFGAAFDSYVYALSALCSYWVAVEVMHCLFDVVVFIPRFAHGVIDKFTKEDAVK